MAKDIPQNISNNAQPQHLKISDKQTETLARRLLPEIKRFFTDEDIRREFEEWKQHNKR